jgi:hypothetical protein
MKKYADRNGFNLFRGNIWYFLVRLSKATNYWTPDAQYIHLQGNRLSNRGVLRSEPRCSIRKAGIINGAILIVSRIDKIKAQIGQADRANTYYK